MLPPSVEQDAGAVAVLLDDLFSAMDSPARRLTDAMRYATMNGGKRMRAALVMASFRLAAAHSPNNGGTIDLGDEAGALRVAAAVECFHAYSLVHDDLPAMDDAATRRGAPSCHLAFDEATAILAGDALQTLAFELLASPETHPDGSVRAKLALALAQASGGAGMAGGQMLDLQAESEILSLEEIRVMQMMKTGALIQFSAVAGGIHGGADPALSTALVEYSRNLGLAFQIADDCLDYAGHAEDLGKPAGQDAARGKGSFVALMGLDEARGAAEHLIEEACSAITSWGVHSKPLAEIARFAISRRS
jgi:farnesyl diphosphate synthase